MMDTLHMLASVSSKYEKALLELAEQAKRIAELEEALENIRDLKHCKDCPPVPGHDDLAPGGHTCGCPQKWAAAALAKLEGK